VDTHTYYELLGVTPDADVSEIKTAFRRLTMKIHPDSGGTNAIFRKVKQAYDTLSDPTLRRQYDDYLSNQTEMYANDNQESNAPGWVRVDDTPGGNEASKPGHDGGHANSPPPRTEYDGAYSFKFTGHDGGHANSPPPHEDPGHTPPPSDPPRGDASGCRHDTEDPGHTPPPPGRNGFAPGLYTSLHADSLAQLVFDKDPFVRYMAAIDNRTPTQSLGYFSIDKDPFVRYAAATNPHTPTESLGLLAWDHWPFVRYAAAINPHTSYEDLKTLLSDKIPAIRMAANHTLSLRH